MFRDEIELFSINRCHQRVATGLYPRYAITHDGFPINMCHQRMVTILVDFACFIGNKGFQSIGVTNEW